jgi:hypothetical protein
VTVTSIGPVADIEANDLEPTMKRQVQHAIATIYEQLRDLPAEHQARILLAAAILLGRADDIVQRCTGKAAS